LESEGEANIMAILTRLVSCLILTICVLRAEGFSIFQVVEFPNDFCKGTNNRNGTCYTKEECDEKGGVTAGSCADGYGMCCTQTLSCGASTSDNNTYLMMSNVKDTNSPCDYKVCASSNNICRIRYDFMAFTLAGPVEGTTTDTAADLTTDIGGGIGDCMTDTFAVSSNGALGSPVICGVNTGQHMIVDLNDRKGCQTAAFTIGAGSTPTRSWDIMVTQYDCSNVDAAGPPGCLQYFTGVSGNIMSYNFPVGATAAVTATTTHLSNQKYTICIRREANMKAICYTAIAANAAAPATQSSFGLSAGAGALTNDACGSDYIEITSALAAADVVATTMPHLGATADLAHKLCGRALNNAGGAAATVCSAAMPFRIGVNFDADEETVAAGATTATDERFMDTGAIVGFKLAFKQVSA